MVKRLRHRPFTAVTGVQIPLESLLVLQLSWLEQPAHNRSVLGSSPRRTIFYFLFKLFGILAQLGEHLPYKQRVTGSSPVGPITAFYVVCRCGGIGRRPGLKIPWVVIPVPVRPRSPALQRNGCRYYICGCFFMLLYNFSYKTIFIYGHNAIIILYQVIRTFVLFNIIIFYFDLTYIILESVQALC